MPSASTPSFFVSESTSFMHYENTTRYHGGKQLHQVRRLFGGLAAESGASGRDRDKPPDMTCFVIFADTKQAKHAIEPKAVPRGLGLSSVWKDSHIFITVPSNCGFKPRVSVAAHASQWLVPVYHGVAMESGDANLSAHHYSLHYFWAAASKHAGDERKASVSITLEGACMNVSLLTFAFVAISPNRTHVAGCVDDDHWLCRPAEVSMFTIDANGRAIERRLDVEEHFQLHFAPRSYGHGSTGRMRKQAVQSMTPSNVSKLRKACSTASSGTAKCPADLSVVDGCVRNGGSLLRTARHHPYGGASVMWTDSPGVVNGGEVQEVTSFGSGVLSLSPPSLPNEFGSAFPGLSARGEELSDAVDGWSMLDSFSLPMDDGVFCNEASMGARTIAAAGQSWSARVTREPSMFGAPPSTGGSGAFGGLGALQQAAASAHFSKLFSQ